MDLFSVVYWTHIWQNNQMLWKMLCRVHDPETINWSWIVVTSRLHLGFSTQSLRASEGVLLLQPLNLDPSFPSSVPVKQELRNHWLLLPEKAGFQGKRPQMLGSAVGTSSPLFWLSSYVPFPGFLIHSSIFKIYFIWLSLMGILIWNS